MERREIIQVNGAVILIVMVILANALAIGFIDRFFHFRLFLLTRDQAIEYSEELGRVRALKNEIVRLEGAPNWNATVYVKHHPGTREHEAE